MVQDLPDAIGAYQRAHDAGDTEAALASFAADATVIDESHARTGTEQIRSWLAKTANEYTYTRTLLSVEQVGDDDFLVRSHLEGDFPGGQVDLRYRFTLRDGLIERLEIAP